MQLGDDSVRSSRCGGGHGDAFQDGAIRINQGGAKLGAAEIEANCETGNGLRSSRLQGVQPRHAGGEVWRVKGE